MRYLLVALFLAFSGCTQMYNTNEVSVYDAGVELSYETGVVEDVKKVILKDDGSGALVGAYSGAVLGSMVGGGRGSVLSALVGGIAGFFAGNELDKANGEELFIKLDSGKHIAVVVKGVKIKKGDRVRIIKRGSRIVRVEVIKS